MLDSFPARRRAADDLFGAGDCTERAWTFLGLSIANWSLICFAAIALSARWSRCDALQR